MLWWHWRWTGGVGYGEGSLQRRVLGRQRVQDPSLHILKDSLMIRLVQFWVLSFLRIATPWTSLLIEKREKEEQMGVIFGYWNGLSQFRIFFLCRICHVLSLLRLVSNYVLLLIFLSSQKILSKEISQTNPAVLILG
jgi:hypothetical protein